MVVLFSGKGMKMKVQKYEIARVIDKLKSIVQKNDQFPALGGILVKDGYLIASNSEITMKVKLEASEGSYFIIPMKAFDLIKNLPDGEIDISATDKNVVMIKIGAIKNKYGPDRSNDQSKDVYRGKTTGSVPDRRRCAEYQYPG